MGSDERASNRLSRPVNFNIFTKTDFESLTNNNLKYSEVVEKFDSAAACAFRSAYEEMVAAPVSEIEKTSWWIVFANPTLP